MTKDLLNQFLYPIFSVVPLPDFFFAFIQSILLFISSFQLALFPVFIDLHFSTFQLKTHAYTKPDILITLACLFCMIPSFLHDISVSILSRIKLFFLKKTMLQDTLPSNMVGLNIFFVGQFLRGAFNISCFFISPVKSQCVTP